MQAQPQLSFITMLLMISFASVNAVLFTPALPAIENFFAISTALAQQTITWFLIGYALAQLVYGPLANRFGRKPALFFGIILQIVSSFICIFSGITHDYTILILGRFLLALGSGVGLKMTFTLINESYDPLIASRKISYLLVAFAITPGLGVMLGGFLNTYLGWQSTFYAGAIYGIILLFLTMKITETKKILDLNALKLKHLLKAYASQFQNMKIISGGMLMGGSTCFVYVFAALAPFIAINMLNMSSAAYGTANLLPPIGLVLGSIFSAYLSNKYPLTFIIRLGIYITLAGSGMMLLFVLMKLSVLLILFIPMMLCYFGLPLILANASTIAMNHVSDKAHASAVINFVNMGFATLIVVLIGFLPSFKLLMPSIFIGVCMMMFASIKVLSKY